MMANAGSVASANFERVLREAREGRAFRNYLEVRDAVLRMLDQPLAGNLTPSAYWAEELRGFEHLLDASPLLVSNWRHQCYHVTGLHDYEYRRHHAHRAGPLEQRLRALQALDQTGLCVPESPLLGGFGYEVDGKLYNVDTLKFYESLLAMERGGLLQPLRGSKQRQIILEIGAGWGGFAYQFKTLFPDVTYVIVDLPGTLLFSGTYLKTTFPDARVLLCDHRDKLAGCNNLSSYDFVLLPHLYWESTTLPAPDLAVNMISFQEMTSAQVEGYLAVLARLGCRHVYSHNRERSAHNLELTTVSSIMERFYDLAEIKVLDSAYTSVKAKKGATRRSPRWRELAGAAWASLVGRSRRRKQKAVTVHDYRHLVGKLKPVAHQPLAA